MNEEKKLRIEWKWGALAAVGVMLLALWPQMNMWIARGGNWQGSYVSVQGDEVAYSAYINALIDHRPRRNDPYSGRDDSPTQPRPESLFSVQFLPAYAVALPARLLGLSASTAFIILIALAAFAASLAIFWLLATITGDSRLAATGAIVVLCLGTLVASQGEARVLLGLTIIFDDYFPFLRRYQPSVTFPLMFIMFGCVWNALRSETRRAIAGWTVAAGAIIAVLVFSYFYLWTAAAAWLACLGIVWLVARPQEWRRVASVFGTIGAFAVAALIPYFILLSHRATETDASVLMIYSHAPDLLRVPELLSAAVLAIFALQAWRGKVNWRSGHVLFTTSLALMTFAVFNQQVLTGRSLQPIHYEIFITNYVALLASVLAASILFSGQETSREIPRRILALLTIVVFGWGIVEATGATNRNVTQARLRDDAMPVMKWLAQESKRSGFRGVDSDPGNPRTVVFASPLAIADTLPTGAPQAQLFVGRLAYYGGSDQAEMKERFYQYLYYSGTGEKELAQAISEGRFAIMASLFGIDRIIPGLAANQQRVTIEEARAELRKYSDYINSFSRERAGRPTLSYVVVPTEAAPDLTNLDRWYERAPGEQAGLFTIYRVKLRP
ncbi:MAG TPA: hypothetical protein VGO68_09120 [Pyrinomonadaceae bacterium]|jgi:hypothetical protein|nr:hypothetical protein [Pyrinomonadaceae bacterium]